MAELIWTEPALEDLDRIADYIALDDPAAAARLVHRVFSHVEQLEDHPQSGSPVPEFRGSQVRYRLIVEAPCRVIYRYHAKTGLVSILHVIKGERLLRKARVLKRDRRKSDT